MNKNNIYNDFLRYVLWNWFKMLYHSPNHIFIWYFLFIKGEAAKLFLITFKRKVYISAGIFQGAPRQCPGPWGQLPQLSPWSIGPSFCHSVNNVIVHCVYQENNTQRKKLNISKPETGTGRKTKRRWSDKTKGEKKKRKN